MSWKTAQEQRGFALFACLVILLVLTVLATAGVQNSLLQERMAGHIRDRDVAFQAAEAALREGEAFLSQATLPAFDGSDGLYQPAAPGDAPVWAGVDWFTEARTYSGSLPGLAEPPQYIIEELPATFAASGSVAADEPAVDAGMYRITARSIGGSGNTEVVLQTTFRR